MVDERSEVLDFYRTDNSIAYDGADSIAVEQMVKDLSALGTPKVQEERSDILNS